MKRKKKKTRLSESTAKMYGKEYEFPVNEVLSKYDMDLKLGRAFAWYSRESTPKQRKSWCLEYLKHIEAPEEDISLLKSLHPSKFDNNAHYMRMIVIGAPINENLIQGIQDALVRLQNDAKTKQVSKQGQPTLTIQERTEKRTHELLSELEAEYDNFFIDKKITSFSLYSWLSKNAIPKTHAKGINEFFTDIAEELKLITTDENVREAYNFLTKQQLKDLIVFVDMFVTDSVKWIEVTKRQPRAKKIKPAHKIVAKMTYQETNIEFKIASVDPAKIIGADKVILFNAKTRDVIILFTNDVIGFTVSGSTIKNIDMAKSFKQKLRKPEDVLGVLSGKGINLIKKTMAALTTKPQKTNGHVSKEMVIMQVMK